jgi:hypothetical protein
MMRKAPGAHPKLGLSLTSSKRERERERESVWKEKKKREDSFLFPFLSFFLLF